MTSNPDALRHVVLFGLKPDASAEAKDELVRRFEQLSRDIPGVEAFEWGVNCSDEGLNGGLTHAFVLTFANPSARDAYLPHPLHAAFVDWSRQVVERATVFDFVPLRGAGR